MKKITIEREAGPSLTVYFADDAFVHICPAPSAEQQTELMKFVSAALFEAGKTGNYYLQYAYFNPGNKNQLKMMYAQEINPSNIIQMNPHYDAEKAENNPANPEELESENILTIFEKTRRSATEVIRGERKPPVTEEREHIIHENHDSPQRRIEAASKLYNHALKKDNQDEAALFAEFVIQPDHAFIAELHEINQRKEIVDVSEHIQAIRKSISHQEDRDISSYKEKTADYLEEELNQALSAATGLITSYAGQLEQLPERKTLQEKISSYTVLKDRKNEFMSELTAALYHAAKEYYLSIWKNDAPSAESLQAEISAFNLIFNGIIKIDPDNLSLSTIEDAFRKLTLNKYKTENIETLMTGILNAAYAKNAEARVSSFMSTARAKIGAQTTAQHRDAIEFIIKQLGEFDPNQSHFPRITRQVTKHQFRFNEPTREMLLAFDHIHEALLATKPADIDSIYTTGTNLIGMAREVKREDGPQAEYTNLASLREKFHVTEQNIRRFEEIAEERNTLSKDLDNVEQHLFSEEASLDYLQLPNAAAVDGQNITDEPESALAQQYLALVDVIQREQSLLSNEVESIENQIQLQRELLERVVKKSCESSIHLSPVTDTQVILSFETRETANPQGALEHVSDNIRSMERDIKGLISSIQQSREELSNKVASIYFLAGLNTTTHDIAELQQRSVITVPNHGSLDDLVTQALDDHTALQQELNQKLEHFRSHDEREQANAQNALTDFPVLLAHIESKYEALQSQIRENEARIEASKNDAYDILQCQLLVNAITNFQYWQTTVGTFGTHTKMTVNHQSYIVPNEIDGMLNLFTVLQQNPGWDTNADAARAMIQNLKHYVQQHPSRNPAVTGLYNTIQGIQPAAGEVRLSNIRAKAIAMGEILPGQPTRTSIASVSHNTIQRQTSTFWQRHPVLKKALIGALIGTIIPVLGTIIGAFIGYAVGKRDERRALQPPVAVPEEQQSLLANDHANNPFDQQRQASTPDIRQSLHHTNPFVESDDEPSVEEVNFDVLDKLVADIDKIDPEEVIRSLPPVQKKESPSLFRKKSDPALQAKFAFEDAFANNLKQEIIALISKNLLISDQLSFERNITKMFNSTWNQREKNPQKRDANLNNIIESLMMAYNQTCTREVIQGIVAKTTQSQPRLDSNLFKGSPLLDYGLQDALNQRQRFV